MASMWRRAMVYLGLVDDEEYEEYDGVGDESMPPAYARRGGRLVRLVVHGHSAKQLRGECPGWVAGDRDRGELRDRVDGQGPRLETVYEDRRLPCLRRAS